MKILLAIVFAGLLAGCGGGEPSTPTANVPLPFRLASPVSGDTETVLHLYQALYGKAPSNPQLTTFKSQIAANGAVSWVNTTAAEFNSLSNRAFAERVLNNISITPTSLTATPTFGPSLQAYNALLGGFADYLSLVGVGSRGVVAAQLAKIISGLEVDTQFGVYGSAALSLNRQITVNSTYSADPKNLVDGVIPTANVAPVAIARVTPRAVIGSSISLDGSASSDANSDLLTYSWTLSSKPSGSMASMSSTTSASPTFVPDVAGTYGVDLVVNDGKLSSTISTTTVTVVPRIAGALGISATDNFRDFCGINGQFTIFSASGSGTWSFSNCSVFGNAGSPLIVLLQNNGSTAVTLTQIQVLAGFFGNGWNISPSSQTIEPGRTVEFGLPLWMGVEVTNAVATFKFTGEPDLVVRLKGSMTLP